VRLVSRLGGVEAIDMIVGGFPCQDISTAGDTRGLGGQKSSLFYEVARRSKDLPPNYVFLENVAAITGKNMQDVLRTGRRTLHDAGYDSVWCVLFASHAGAPHKRARWFLLGTKRGVPHIHGVPPITTASQHEWSQRWPDSPPMHERLLMASQPDTKTRNEVIGNMVNTRQAALAFRYRSGVAVPSDDQTPSCIYRTQI